MSQAGTSGPSSVAVLIPVHNGSERIAGLLVQLEALPLDVCVVDDGSTDGTAEAVSNTGARLVRLPIRKGKGAALKRGLREILSKSPPEWVLFMDGDGQHLPSEVPRFLEAMEGPYDLLAGSRMEEAGSIPLARRMPNRMGSEILRWMSGQAVPDTQCGFRAIRSSFLTRMDLESEGYEIETEILLKALKMGARWHTVAVSAVYDGQESHFRPVADTFKICMAALRYVAG
jgi:glycosyltransferase involved in cell wall biosynthesis